MTMADTIWVMSNRRDNRVVLWERDAAHPGGEAFVASSAPAEVGKTGAVERLMREGLLVEVSEPKDGPKKPLTVEAVDPSETADGPGRPTRLGRAIDGDLFNDAAVKRIEDKQDAAPREVPVPAGAIVPPAPSEAESERTRSRR